MRRTVASAPRAAARSLGPREVSWRLTEPCGHRLRTPARMQLTVKSEDYAMSITLKRSLAGLALLAALAAAGCSSSSSSSHPAQTHHSSAPGNASGKIPQHNGGDHDGDNNGGPSDGDGNQ